MTIVIVSWLIIFWFIVGFFVILADLENVCCINIRDDSKYFAKLTVYLLVLMLMWPIKKHVMHFAININYKTYRRR